MPKGVRPEEKREQLYTIFSRNWEEVKKHLKVRIEPNVHDTYLCPICFKYFTREGLKDSYDDCLTLEDVPPSSLGGKVRTVTCKICNNTGGSELESHLPLKLRMDEFTQGIPNASIDSIFNPAPNINLDATIHQRGPNLLHIQYYLNRSNPKDIEKLHELEAKGDFLYSSTQA